MIVFALQEENEYLKQELDKRLEQLSYFSCKVWELQKENDNLKEQLRNNRLYMNLYRRNR